MEWKKTLVKFTRETTERKGLITSPSMLYTILKQFASYSTTRTLNQETFLSKNDKQNINATSLICVLKNMCYFLKKKNHKHVFWDSRIILWGIFKHQISIFQENACLKIQNLNKLQGRMKQSPSVFKTGRLLEAWSFLPVTFHLSAPYYTHTKRQLEKVEVCS